LAIFLGTPLGILLGLALQARILPIRYSLLFLTDVIRSLPVLILILWVYYFVPVFIGMPDMNSFSLAAIALTINLAAFIADVVRARIISFPNGLIDAAYACGLSKFSTFVHIMLPEIIREILPTLSLLYIDILKLSSLASVIGVYELVHTADKVRVETFQAIEVFSVVALSQFVLQ
jgi:polar amino acid transport system permease protein